MPKDTGLNPRSCKSDVFPSWRKPCPMGYFSVGSDRFYISGHRNLRYYKEPNPEAFPLDLNAGMGTAKRKIGCPLDEGIDRLLHFIVDNHSSLVTNFDKILGEQPSGRQQNPLFPVEFVSWRGLLRLLMCTPFEYRQNWIIRVTRYKGTFYLSQVETDEAKRDRMNETEMQLRMTSWGFKFEQYCLAKTPDDIPKTNVPVDECSEFSVVFYTKLAEKHNLLLGAEMDCIKSDRPVHLETKLPLEDLEFLELKTSLGNLSQRKLHTYLCYKIRNWWCQSFLVGINKIFVGWRDENGFINRIEEVKVSQLPGKAKNWNPNKCASFLVSFLDRLKSLMSKVDCPNTVWEFKYHASNSLITYDTFEVDTGKSFLSSYYIEFIEKLSKQTGRD